MFLVITISATIDHRHGQHDEQAGQQLPLR